MGNYKTKFLILMKIEVTPIEKDQRYRVNGKEMYKDSNSNWVASQELTSKEYRAFYNYYQQYIENNSEEHPKKVYNY